MKKIKPRFVCNEKSKRRGVFLTVKDFEILIEGLEDYEDYGLIKERKKGEQVGIPLEEVKARLFGKN